MYDMKPLIQKFRDNRKRLGISQTEFARRIGTSLATITRWERGNMVYTPDLRQLSLIADMFDTTVWELLTPAASGTVTNDESMTEAEVSTAEIESIAREATAVTSHEKMEEEPSAASGVSTDDEQGPAQTITPDETQQEVDVQNAVTPDEIPQSVDALPVASSNDDDLPAGGVSSEAPEDVIVHEEGGVLSDTQEGASSSPEAQSVVNVDEETAEPEMSEIVSHEETTTVDEPMAETIMNDESLEATQSVMSAADSEAIQESLLPVTNDEMPQDADTPSLGSDDELPQAEAAPEVQEIVSIDERGSGASSTPQEQGTEVVTSDEITPDVEVASTEMPESVISDETTSGAQDIIINDETQEEHSTPLVVSADVLPTEDSPSQELFSIVTPEEIQATQETTVAEAEAAVADISLIDSNDESTEDQPDAAIVSSDDMSESVMIDENSSEEGVAQEALTAMLNGEAREKLPEADIITSDDSIESVVPDEESRHETVSVMNDENAIEESTMPEAQPIINRDAPAEDRPLALVVTADDVIDSVVEAEQAEQVELQEADNAVPELFSIITSDETRRENDAPILRSGEDLPQETPASEAPSSVINDEAQETAADIPSEALQEKTLDTTKMPSKPWEALGMSKAWYYRLRQQGRLEEYLKEKAKN